MCSMFLHWLALPKEQFHSLNKLYTKEWHNKEMTKWHRGEKGNNKFLTKKLYIQNTYSFKISFLSLDTHIYIQ